MNDQSGTTRQGAAHLTRLSQEQAQEIARKHEMLYSGRMGGARAVYSFCDLTGLNLSGFNLSDADFTGAVMADCNFAGTKLDRAVFFCSDLRRANLARANLRRADLRGACLRGAFMVGADLFEADLREGVIAEKDQKGNLTFLRHELRPSEMQSVVLANANLERARLNGIIAVQADFTDAVMRNCKLVRANLRQCKFVGANLEGADLSGSDLKGANLQGAVLVGADMTMAVTDGADMSGILTDAPAGISLSTLTEPIEHLLAQHISWVESSGAHGKPLDLSGVDLRPLKNLASANLTALKANGAVLYGMNLPAIQLQGAQLQGADLRAAKLVGADLRGANLKNAKLNNTDLRDANLGPLILTADRLLPAQFQGACIRYSDMRGADLLRTNFQGADLSYSNLIGTKLRSTDFSEANLDTTLFSKGALHEANAAGCKGLPPD